MRLTILLDTLIRAEGGASECTGNPRVVRGAYVEDNDPESLTYNANWDSNFCKSGMVQKELKMFIQI